MARHIAIVEDEATIRHNYEDALRRYGYQVSGYGDKHSALAALKRRLPDLVIIDGDPLVNIRNTRNVKTVIKQGQVHDAATLLESVRGKLGPATEDDLEQW